MLRGPEQPPGGEGGGDKSLIKIEPVPVGLLLAFIRQLIAHQVSSDVLLLSLMGAKQTYGATEKEMKALEKAISREYAANRMWPAGF